ncbi:MAG: 30S ribosomal protein S9, partial [Bacteroidetes bacterium]|nr:30S ribosomal protein S9 [Bacteroidota bacterium]
METINKIGRRKAAVARVYLSKGKGKITVNEKDGAVYFPIPTQQYKINQPFAITGTEGQYDLKVNVDGGGTTGQVEAVRMAIS